MEYEEIYRVSTLKIWFISGVFDIFFIHPCDFRISQHLGGHNLV
jgi:hypothetical protein